MVAEQKKSEKDQLHQNFADNWSIIGFRYVFYDRGVRKLCWVLLLLTSTILAGFLFYDTVLDYFDYKTYIVTTVDYNTETLAFPSITFCNMNPQNVAGAKRKNIVKDLTEFKSLYAYLADDNSSNADPIDTASVLQWMDRVNFTTYKQAINNIEFSFREMAEQSKIKAMLGTTCTFEETACTRHDMTDTMSWRHSLCYQFNPYNLHGISRNSTMTGINGGLTIYLDLGTSASELSTYPYKGMEIIINPFGMPHVLDKYNEAVFVQPGTMNVISIDVKKTTLLEDPYDTNCTYGQTLKVMHSFPYSKAICELDCILMKIIDKCGCVGFEYSNYVTNVTACRVDQITCWFKWRDQYKTIPKACNVMCPRECEFYSYKLSLSQGTMGNNDLYDTAKGKEGMSKAEAKEYLEENVVGFKIAYRRLYARQDTVTAVVTWTGLLGDVGGNLGLCMGLSILTVFELFFFIFDYVTILFGCRSKKTMDSPDTGRETMAGEEDGSSQNTKC